MTDRMQRDMGTPEIRRAFEEELLVMEATDTVGGLLESLGLSQKELAERLGVTAGRVSQILSGSENLTLRSLGALGWALGIRFDLAPSSMANRQGTPAVNDPESPSWLGRMRPQSSWSFRPLTLPDAGRLKSKRPSLKVIDGEVRAA